MLPSLELFSLIVEEGLVPLVNAIDLLGGGMPLFPTSNYSKSLLEPATAKWSWLHYVSERNSRGKLKRAWTTGTKYSACGSDGPAKT